MEELDEVIKSIIEETGSMEKLEFDEMERVLNSILEKILPTNEEDRS